MNGMRYTAGGWLMKMRDRGASRMNMSVVAKASLYIFIFFVVAYGAALLENRIMLALASRYEKKHGVSEQDIEEARTSELLGGGYLPEEK
jgi:hypothetical protein